MPALSTIATVLTVAGSDPSGGAGIQADIKAFVTTGAYGAAVITGLTAQNTTEVSGTYPVPAAFVEKQIRAVISDIKIDVIKLGMMTSREICERVAPFLKNIPVVCDPVMISTTGHPLIDQDTADALESAVLPLCDYITPNRFELEKLCGNEGIKDVRDAGRKLFARFSGLSGIVLKGGHIDAENASVTDILLYREGERVEEAVKTQPRYDTPNTHGTGCTFASAFASYLAQGCMASEAFDRAAGYTNRLIQISAGASVGQGRGPLLHHLSSTPSKSKM